MKQSSRELGGAIAILVGCVIGAGVFGIPYVIAKSGFLIGFLYMLVIGLMIIVHNLRIGEICLRTKGIHQLSGYAERYLGMKGKILITFSTTFIIVGALIAYLIGEGQTLSAIFGGSPFSYSLIFFLIMSSLIFFDLKAVKESEFFMGLLMIVFFIGIIVLSLPSAKLSNLYHLDISNIFLPYGVILFAFLGSVAIPEMRVELEKNKKLLKKAILIGMAIPFVIYLLFVTVVVAVTGTGTSEVSSIALGRAVGPHMVFIGNLAAIFAMATSFLALGLALKWLLQYDYKLNRNIAWFLTCVVPFALFLSGVQSFIKTIEIAGAVAAGIEGITVVSMFHKAKKFGDRKPEYVLKENKLISALLIIVFLCGMIYTLLHFFGLV